MEGQRDRRMDPKKSVTTDGKRKRQEEEFDDSWNNRWTDGRTNPRKWCEDASKKVLITDGLWNNGGEVEMKAKQELKIDIRTSSTKDAVVIPDTSELFTK